MTELKLFNILSKRRVRHEYQQSNIDQRTIWQEESKTLPWLLQAEIYGTNYEVVCQTESILEFKSQSSGIVSTNTIFPSFIGTGIRNGNATQCFNLNNSQSNDVHHQVCDAERNASSVSQVRITAQEQTYDEKSFRKIPRNTKAQAGNDSFENFQTFPEVASSFKSYLGSNEVRNRYNECQQKNNMCVVKSGENNFANTSQITCETESCHSPKHSNMNSSEVFRNREELVTRILSPMKSLTLKMNTKLNKEQTKLLPTNSTELYKLFDPLIHASETSCPANNLSNVVHTIKPKMHVGLEVNMLFLTKLFRQIYNLQFASVRKKAMEINSNGNYLKSNRKLKGNRLTYTTNNSLVVTFSTDYSNLNTNNISSEPTVSSQQQTHVNFGIFRQVRPLFAQSSHLADIHSIRKWHSGMLKVKRKLY